MKQHKKPWTGTDLQISLLALPTAVWFLLFSYLPMFGVIIAFKKYHINGGFLHSLITSKWVGLHYFKLLLNNDDVWLALRNTILYNVVMLVVGTALTLALALLVSELHNKFLAKIYQTLMFFPHFLSWVVITALVWGFLSHDMGIANDIIVKLGFEGHKFYMEPNFWPGFLVFLSQWKSIGYGMIVYLATITALDKEVYEAALLDGASKWKQVTRITLPMMKTVIVLMFILNIGHIFYSDFGLFYQVPRDSNTLANTVTTLDVFVYKQLMSPTSPIGMTAAAALFQSVTAFVLTLMANKMVSKIDPESAMI
ncbi:MAG: ABC transporter permease subunit [Treponema sp.]|jgi:putative aldouronate transport system permease protein|nr:ABC transporter permease subunit [Treponema sp.]